MRIPLDYFRALGIPFQVSTEQISQAYQDRLIQLPRREYSEAAIAARREILQTAYGVLTDPEQRDSYQERWWPTHPSTPAPETDPYLEIAPAQLMGGLLLLQDLGEYEEVLKLAEGELYRPEDPAALQTIRADLILITALAYLELGRESWQRSDYETAAATVLKGLAWLQREAQFPEVQNEIREELFRLRPYRILELVADPDLDSPERAKGIQLLQEMIQDRFGIEGRGNDRSGLGIDDFLQFIQQLRPQLTAAEQESLFVPEAERPSVIASYLAVYALLAQVITEKKPNYLERCKTLLLQLKNRQDVALEEAICALLLGQADEALTLVEECQDEKVQSFIRNASTEGADQLPGLYAYAEHWLDQDIFPCFRNLPTIQGRIALENYFSDPTVQHYLVDPHYSSSSPLTPAVSSSTVQDSTMARNLAQYQDDSPPQRPAYRRNGASFRSSGSEETAQQSTLTATAPPETSPLVWPGTTPSPVATYGSSYLMPDDYLPAETTVVKPARKRRRRVVRINPLRFGLFLCGCVGLVGGLIWWLQSSRPPLAALEADQLMVSLNEAAIELPSVSKISLATAPTGNLTPATAEQLIEYWLNVKAAAFGPKHQISDLDLVLTPPLLLQWRNRAQREKSDQAFRRYQHQVEVLDVQMDAPTADKAVITAKVTENTRYYRHRDPQKLQKTSTDDLTIAYRVVRQDNQWRIQGATVK